MTKLSDVERALPVLDPSLNRFWRVTLDKKSPAKPIKVALFEAVIVGDLVSRTLATELAYTRTTASPEAVGVAAKDVMTAVSDYLSVIGDFPVVKEPNA